MHNNKDVIEDTIRSVMEQTYNNWELLLIDDASSDKTTEVVEKILLTDSRIQLIKLLENKGAAEARNLGTKNANGKYIAFLDADDTWHPDKVSLQPKYV